MKAIIIASLLCIAGCQAAPKYPEQPFNGITISRDASGYQMQLMNKADTDVSIEEANYDATTKAFKLKNAKFVSAQSKNQEVLERWMVRYTEQQQKFNEQMMIHGQNAERILDATGRNIVQPLTSIGIKYLENRALFNTNATQLRMNRQEVGQDLAHLVLGGQLPLDTVRRQAEPEVLNEVLKQINDMQTSINELKKPVPASTQPNATANMPKGKALAAADDEAAMTYEGFNRDFRLGLAQ